MPLRHQLLRLLIQIQNRFHHQKLLIQRHILILFMKRILLQEPQPDHAGDLQRQLLIIRKHIGTDQLDRLHQLILRVQKRNDPCPVLNELLIDILRIPRRQIPLILTITLHPVDSRIMPRVSQSLIQPPEATHKTLCIHRDRLRKITALRGHRTDDRNRTDIPAQSLHLSCPLIKSSKTGSQISREALLSGHLLHTAGELAQSLCPAGCRVCHDCNVIAHIPVVLSQRDTSIDGSFAGSDRHVRGVCDQRRAGHQLVARLRILQLGEIFQNLRHLIAALTAADVNNDICIGELRNGVLSHGLAGSETARYGGCTAARNRENCIQNSLSGDQRHRRRHTSGRRTRHADRPLLSERKLPVRAVRQSDRHDRLIDRVIPFRCYFLDNSLLDERRHHGTVYNRLCFLALSNDGAARNLIAGLYLHRYFPVLLLVKRTDGDAAGNIFARFLRNLGQRSLYTVKYIIQDAGTERNRERVSRSANDFTRLHTAGLLIDLNRGRITGE